MRVTAGPLRAIEPEAMQFAWRGVTEEAGVDGARLELDALPWTLRCPICGYGWTAPQLECACPGCGANRAFPVGGDELQVTSIEIEDAEDPETAADVEGQTSAKGSV